MQPSTAITNMASAQDCVVDSLGRRLAVRRLTALDKLRIFKASGPDLSLNQPWLAVAMLAGSVTSIDDVPVPFPATEAQIESLVGVLGDAGLEAIAETLEPSELADQKQQVAAAGNSSGTPI